MECVDVIQSLLNYSTSCEVLVAFLPPLMLARYVGSQAADSTCCLQTAASKYRPLLKEPTGVCAIVTTSLASSGCVGDEFVWW